MKNSISRLVPVIFILLLLGTPVLAQTTGKIAGSVIDASTNEPMVGANIIINGTSFGAAVDLDGNFYIINIPPGTYTLLVQMIGYETTRLQNLKVSVNRTTSVEVALKPDILETDVIVVEASKIGQKKDQTGSMSTLSAEQIAVLPIESVGAIVGMQAGVVNGHFRGGRMDEVSYLIDGLPVNDAFGGEGQTVTLEPESVQDLEVITGTFNAEYGRAMSGIVNAVTREGGGEYHASFSAAYGNYFTANKDIFIGLKDTEFNRNQDYKLMVSGPLFTDKLSFFLNTRYQNNKNHLNGIYRFKMDDYSDFGSYPDLGPWISLHTGDNSYVPMDGSENLSFMGKLNYDLFTTVKISFLFTRNDDRWDGYDHTYKYAPKGQASSYRESNMYLFQMNHTLGKSAFYEAKLSYVDNYDGYYLYKNPLDERYISDIYQGNNAQTGFWTGGQNKGHSENWQRDVNFKLDLTWQLSQKHSLKGGMLYTYHDLKNLYSQIRNLPEYENINWLWWQSFDENGNLIPPPYQPVVSLDTTVYSDFYSAKPVEYSVYLQDKMEYEDMVVNLGLRLDYFDPKAVYPSQRRNPANQSNFLPDNPEKMSTYPEADVKYQISPRLGLAYQLGNRAVLHFSFGHFFQIPPMYALYSNNNFLVHRPDYSVTMGNAQVKAQKNVQYEVGLWQELMKDMGLEVTLYYVDIYNLLSAIVVSTFNETEYGIYSNKDYGNTKGLTIKYDYRLGNLSAFLNYTLQYTRGNADNPTQSFDRTGASQDPINKLIAMSWDQRHTLNLTVGYNKPNWGITTTSYFNSGTPYTWQPLAVNPLSRVNLYPNNDYSPTRMSVDLSAYYGINIYKNAQLRITLDAYNLLDRLNEYGLNAQTGRAYTAIIQPADLGNHRSNFSAYEDRFHNPATYSAPRLIKLGIGVSY